MEVDAIGDCLHKNAFIIQRRANQPRLAMIQPCHCVKDMRYMICAGVETVAGKVIIGYCVPERDNDVGGDRLFDNLQSAFKFRRNCYHLQIIAGNCHLSRPVAKTIAANGFAIADVDTMYLPKTPRFAGWSEWGIARPA